MPERMSTKKTKKTGLEERIKAKQAIILARSPIQCCAFPSYIINVFIGVYMSSCGKLCINYPLCYYVRDSNLGSVLSVFFCHYFSILMSISVFYPTSTESGRWSSFFYYCLGRAIYNLLINAHLSVLLVSFRIVSFLSPFFRIKYG